MISLAFEQLVVEMREKPWTMLTIAFLIAFSFYGWLNFARASEVEDVKRELEDQGKIQECRWLSDKIESLENKLYVLERDGADPERIHEKDQQLRKFQDRYDATTCAVTKY